MKGLKLGQKVLIIGSPGSGKSTLGKKLHKITNYPLHHLDVIWWRPNWTHISDDEFLNKINSITSTDAWIIDGQYSRNLEVRLQKADTVIFLDYKRGVCISRILKRIIKYHKTPRDDIYEGCPEKLDFSFLKWTWGYPKREKPNIYKFMKKYENVNWIVFKNTKELNKYLKILENNSFLPSLKRH